MGKSWFALNVPMGTRVWLGAGTTALLGAGAVLSVASWQKSSAWVDLAPADAVAVLALGLLFLTVGGFRLMQRAPKGGSAYAPFILGLGILMNGVGGMGVVGVAGLIHSQQLAREDDEVEIVAPPEGGIATDPEKQARETAVRTGEQRRARFVLLAGAMGFIGSIFYIALALYRKQHDKQEAFDVGKLVSGAALRSGESMLFVLCFVLLTQVQSSSQLDGWLPVTGLMLGMFVKSGERLVFNLAERIFDFAQTIIPGGREKREPNAVIEADDALDAGMPEPEERREEPRANGSKPPPPMPSIADPAPPSPGPS